MQIRRPMALGFLVLIAAGTACGLPQLANSQPRQLAQTSFLYAADGSLITELHAGEDRVMLGYTQMPQSIKDAVIAIEDQRFWYHHGVDGRALLRAAYINVLSGQIVEGGSTITQQLVKNLYVGDEQTFTRKIDEAALAWQIEDQLSIAPSDRKLKAVIPASRRSRPLRYRLPVPSRSGRCEARVGRLIQPAMTRRMSSAVPQ